MDSFFFCFFTPALLSFLDAFASAPVSGESSYSLHGDTPPIMNVNASWSIQAVNQRITLSNGFRKTLLETSSLGREE